MKPLTIECRRVLPFDAGSIEAAQRALQGCTPCKLRQAWLEREEAEFQPGSVRVGWRDDLLFVLAELTDSDIHSDATAHNQWMWELGDTFEMFLRPAEQKSYAEFHVTPNGFRLQLRFPDAGSIARVRAKKAKLDDYLIQERMFRSTALVHPSGRNWLVLAEIPAKSVCERPKPLAGSEWFFSFSRYDYRRSRSEPVISSTSPHTKPDFHCQAEWDTMRFQAGG
jgi:hypothetical protein